VHSTPSPFVIAQTRRPFLAQTGYVICAGINKLRPFPQTVRPLIPVFVRSALSTMQRPTCTGLRVRTPHDAHVIFHAVSLDLLPMVTRRLDTEERRSISSGCIFVWEERGPNAEAAGLGIERWTDSIRWGPSRVRDEFLYYHEKDAMPIERESSDSDTMSSPPRHREVVANGTLLPISHKILLIPFAPSMTFLSSPR